MLYLTFQDVFLFKKNMVDFKSISCFEFDFISILESDQL